MKRSFIAILAGGAVSSAMAQTEPAAATPRPLTANVTFASQYVFRGLSQTNGKPAIQGGLDYVHSSGFYVGTWLSNVSWYTDQNAGVKSAPQALSAPTA